MEERERGRAKDERKRERKREKMRERREEDERKRADHDYRERESVSAFLYMLMRSLSLHKATLQGFHSVLHSLSPLLSLLHIFSAKVSRGIEREKSIKEREKYYNIDYRQEGKKVRRKSMQILRIKKTSLESLLPSWNNMKKVELLRDTKEEKKGKRERENREKRRKNRKRRKKEYVEKNEWVGRDVKIQFQNYTFQASFLLAQLSTKSFPHLSSFFHLLSLSLSSLQKERERKQERKKEEGEKRKKRVGKKESRIG